MLGIFGERTQPGENAIHKELARWYFVDDMLAEFPKPTEIIDRSLLTLTRLAKDHPWKSIKLSPEELQYILFSSGGSLEKHIAFMHGMGLIEGGLVNREKASITITPRGWARAEELSQTNKDSRQAFVAMWFNPCMAEEEKALKQSVEDAGFTCVLIKNVEHNNKICDAIVAEIRKSRFIVADFTAGPCAGCGTCDKKDACQDKVRPRGGVYFEAGFAMGLGIPVIWTVRRDQIDQVHFDTRQYNHIDYANPEELRVRLSNRIKATIH